MCVCWFLFIAGLRFSVLLFCSLVFTSLLVCSSLHYCIILCYTECSPLCTAPSYWIYCIVFFSISISIVFQLIYSYCYYSVLLHLCYSRVFYSVFSTVSSLFFFTLLFSSNFIYSFLFSVMSPLSCSSSQTLCSH